MSGGDSRLREASQRARGGATGGRGLGGPWLAESQTRWKPEPPSWGSMLSKAPDRQARMIFPRNSPRVGSATNRAPKKKLAEPLPAQGPSPRAS